MDYREATAFLRAHDNYLIITHKRPDGDAIGCSVALAEMLRELGKTAWLLPSLDATDLFTEYLDGQNAPEGFVPDTVVSVDMAGLGLLPPNGADYRDRIDLAIDHHPSFEHFGKANIVRSEAAACGELIYDILAALGPITPDMALPLYEAVSTDTGCFAYANTTPQTHAVAAALMQTSIDYKAVNKVFFRTKTRKRMQLEGAMLDSMEFYDDDRVAILSVPISLMERVQATESDAEDLSALGGQIQGVDCAVTMRELRPDVWKLSLRTGDRVNATDVCRVMGGGGHRAAAGATIEGPWADCRDRVLEAIARNVPDFTR